MEEAGVQDKMNLALVDFKKDISLIRTGRATSALVQDINVASYGGTQNLRIMELASISSPDSQTLIIDPWDKSVIGEIKQAILAANVGMSPVIDGEIIRISFPLMTGEDRQERVKLLHTKMENAKIVVRRVRADAMQDIKKAFEEKEITEDEKFAKEKKLQETTDDFVAKIDEAGAAKEQELLTV